MGRKSYFFDWIEFDDSKKTIIVRGHFPSLICGMLTTVEDMFQMGFIKGEQFQTGDGYSLKGTMIFANLSDYEKISKFIMRKVEEFKDENRME